MEAVFSLCVDQNAVVVEELVLELQDDEDGTATAPLFAEAAAIPLLERSGASFLQAITSGTK